MSAILAFSYKSCLCVSGLPFLESAQRLLILRNWLRFQRTQDRMAVTHKTCFALPTDQFFSPNTITMQTQPNEPTNKMKPEYPEAIFPNYPIRHDQIS
jgi:hypothetical protein